MKKSFIITIVFVIMLISISMFFAIQEKLLDMKMHTLNKNVKESYQELQELKAEWVRINNKEYLKYLVDKYIPNMIPQPGVK